MKTFALRVETTVFERFPEFSAVAFRCSGLPKQAAAQIEMANHLAVTRLGGLSLEGLSRQPRIAVWRDAYRAMGLKPSDHRSSVEQLVRRGMRDSLALTSVPSVELSNRASVAALAPVGGYDLDLLNERTLTVRPAAANDRFEPLGSAKQYSTNDQILVYAQGQRVVSWGINHRDSVETALTTYSSRAIFISEAVDAEGATSSREALDIVWHALALTGAALGPIVHVDARAPIGIIGLRDGRDWI